MIEPGRYVTMTFTLTLLLLFVQQGLSIKCWDCRSDIDAKCSDPFDNRTIGFTDCNEAPLLAHLPQIGKPTMCRKIRQKVAGIWTYHRSCAYLGEPGIEGDERFCLMRTGSYNIFMEYCTCNSRDGCNAGTNLGPTRLVFIFAAFLTMGYLLNFS